MDTALKYFAVSVVVQFVPVVLVLFNMVKLETVLRYGSRSSDHHAHESSKWARAKVKYLL